MHVLITKNPVVGGNDHSRAIETVQREAIDIARSMIQGSLQNLSVSVLEILGKETIIYMFSLGKKEMKRK